MQKALSALLLLLPILLPILQVTAAPSLAASEGAVKVPGTRVFVVPPEGFTPATRFAGFIKKEASASLAVTEIRAPYDQVLAGFSESEMAGRGLSLTASSVITMGKNEDQKASLIEFTQNAFGQKFKKVSCIFGDKNNTTIVTGAMPNGGGNELFNSLKEAAKTARFDAHARVGSLDEGLPFTIADSKKFKKASRLQNVLVFTSTGKSDNTGENGAIFAVGQSAGEVSVGDHESFARERLNRTPQVKNITVEKVNEIKQSGLSGDEFLAKGTDAQDGTPTFVYHAMLFDKDGYYLFQGLCPFSNHQAYLTEYRELVGSFQLR